MLICALKLAGCCQLSCGVPALPATVQRTSVARKCVASDSDAGSAAPLTITGAGGMTRKYDNSLRTFFGEVDHLLVVASVALVVRLQSNPAVRQLPWMFGSAKPRSSAANNTALHGLCRLDWSAADVTVNSIAKALEEMSKSSALPALSADKRKLHRAMDKLFAQHGLTML